MIYKYDSLIYKKIETYNKLLDVNILKLINFYKIGDKA